MQLKREARYEDTQTRTAEVERGDLTADAQ